MQHTHDISIAGPGGLEPPTFRLTAEHSAN
jgi:hypothetical protein